MSASPGQNRRATPLNGKTELGARAAELKERLLKNRGMRHESVGPPPSAPNGVAAQAPQRPVADTEPSPKPAAMKQPSTQKVANGAASTPAAVREDEAEIWRLISSFSSATEDQNPAVKSAPASTRSPQPDVPVGASPTTDVASAPAVSRKVSSSHSTIPGLTISQPASPACAAPVVSQSSVQAKSAQKSDETFQTGEKAATQPAAQPAVKPMAKPVAQATATPATKPVTKPISKEIEKGRIVTKDTSVKTVPARPNQVAKDATANLTNRLVPPKGPTANNKTQNLSNNTPVAPIADIAKPASQQFQSKSTHVKNKSVDKAMPAIAIATPDAASMRPTLAQLLDQEPDVRDWLKITGFFNLDVRNRKLERARKLAEMEKEHSRIEEERRKLMEEDANDNIMSPALLNTPLSEHTAIGSQQAPKRGAPDSPATASQPPAKLARTDIRPPERPLAERRLSMGNGTQTTPMDIRPPQAIRRESGEMRLRTDPAVPSRGRDERDARLDTRRTPPRSDQDHRDIDYRRSPPSRPRDFSPRRQYSQHSNTYRPEPERGGYVRRPSKPRRDVRDVTLGGKGDTRFFILKSFNQENVDSCLEDGVWATQPQNGEMLTAAFAQCRNVIFFFSINKSKAFQGIARMSTPPSPDTPRPRWMNGLNWESTPPFRIEWLSTDEIDFHHVGHIRNSLNENLPVLVGRDGQEIAEQAGRDLYFEMLRLSGLDHDLPDRPEPSDFRPRERERDRGWDRERERERGWDRRDRDDYGSRGEEPRFIKRESMR